MTTFFERRYTGQSGSQPARGKLQPRQGGGQSHTSASATGAATPKGQHFAERMGFWHDMLRVVGGLESDDDEGQMSDQALWGTLWMVSRCVCIMGLCWVLLGSPGSP